LPKAASAAFLFAAALGAWSASAQVLYKWVDQSGKTQYSDRPPKNFKGEVTRIETEVEKTTLPPSVQPTPVATPAPATAAGKVQGAPVVDIAAKRRATRATLGARLDKARLNVEEAKKALAEAESPQPEDRQVIQQRTSGGMHGMTARSNCRVEGSGKTKTLMCPTMIPTEEYRDRVALLEEALRKAEKELEEAERAWRRGVD
jgi:hypothetical protein